MKVSGLSGVALTLGFALPLTGRESNPVLQKIDKDTPFSKELNPFIIIEDTGKITLMLHKPEMGQGTYQSMPVILAEELEVRLDQVEIKMAKADKKYGDMGVGGSNSVKGSWMNLRKAGAAAREMLISAAAQTWNIPAGDCYAREGKVYARTGSRSLAYGELVEKASKLEVPKEPKLKDPKNFKLVGKPVARPDIPLKVDGTAVFGIDVKVPGMLYASIERAPVFHAKVKSVDDSAAKAVQGVKQVLSSERKLNKNTFHGVAVLADNYWAALQGRKALKIEWDNADFDSFNQVRV